jgi:hypothetical protein
MNTAQASDGFSGRIAFSFGAQLLQSRWTAESLAGTGDKSSGLLANKRVACTAGGYSIKNPTFANRRQIWATRQPN